MEMLPKVSNTVTLQIKVASHHLPDIIQNKIHLQVNLTPGTRSIHLTYGFHCFWQIDYQGSTAL